MFRTSLYIAFTVSLLYAGWILTRVGPALRAYRPLIFHVYGETIIVYALLFLFALTLAIMLIARSVMLKDTGRKLQHASKELQAGAMARPTDTLTNLLKTKR